MKRTGQFRNVWVETEKNVFQSQASRRDWDLLSSISDYETRTRIKIKTILARIWFVACAWTDIFPKKAFNFLIFLKIICLLLLRNLNENLIFRDENENFFLSISCFETRTSILFFQSKENFREREVSVLLDSRFAFNIESYLCNVHWSCLDLKDDIVSGRHRSPTQRIGCLAVCEDQPLLFAGVNYSRNYCRIWFKPLCYELWREKKF